MKLRMPPESVGTKLFIIISGAVVFLSAALGLISYQVSKSIIQNEVGTASSQAIGQAADKLDFLFAGYEALSRQLAVDQTLRQDLASVSSPELGAYGRNQASERLRQKLDALTGSDARLLGVRLVAPSLIESASYKSAGISNLRSDATVEERIKLIRDADGEPVWFPALRTGFFGNYQEPTVTMGRLLKNMQKPEAQYVLLIEIREASLGKVLSGIAIGRSGELRIVDGNNRIVHAKDQQLLEEESFIRAEADRLSGEKRHFLAPDEAGIHQLVVFKQMQTAGWTMIGYAPEQDFVGAADRLLYITLLVVIVAIGMAVLIGLYLVRRIGRPLRTLADLMEQGACGDLQIRADFRGRDEIGRLGISFNRMVVQLSSLVNQTSISAREVTGTAKEVAEASLSTSRLAGEIAAVTQEIAAGAEGLALEADNGNQAVHSAGITIEKAEGSNEAMNQAVDRVMGISAEGGTHMQALLAKTDTISGMTGLLKDNSGRLERSTQSIRQILAPMAAMTKQTHILSLNASIEAARAGAAGKGFMVIAEEIRQLAAKSSESLGNVSTITEQIQKDIANTVSVLSEVSPLFTEQLQSVRDAASFFGDVKQEMGELLLHIEESSRCVQEMVASQAVLGHAITNVSLVVQETGSSTYQVADMASGQFEVSERLVALSGNLEQLAEGLNRTLVHFKTQSEDS
jgi:methyl-accepting chemotaxis protein